MAANILGISYDAYSTVNIANQNLNVFESGASNIYTDHGGKALPIGIRTTVFVKRKAKKGGIISDVTTPISMFTSIRAADL